MNEREDDRNEELDDALECILMEMRTAPSSHAYFEGAYDTDGHSVVALPWAFSVRRPRSHVYAEFTQGMDPALVVQGLRKMIAMLESREGAMISNFSCKDVSNHAVRLADGSIEIRPSATKYCTSVTQPTGSMDLNEGAAIIFMYISYDPTSYCSKRPMLDTVGISLIAAPTYSNTWHSQPYIDVHFNREIKPAVVVQVLRQKIAMLESPEGTTICNLRLEPGLTYASRSPDGSIEIRPALSW